MGMSQETLAERLGVSRQAVSKWELNDSAPELDKLLAMADLFGCTTDDLLGRSGPGKSAGDAGSGKEQSAGRAKTQAPSTPPADGWNEVRRIARERGYYVGYLMMFWGCVEAIGAMLVAAVWRSVTHSMMSSVPGVYFAWGQSGLGSSFGHHLEGSGHAMSAISTAPLLLLGFSALVGAVVAVIGAVIVYRGKRKNR